MATTRTSVKRLGLIVSAAFVAMLMVAAPAGAQTYSDGGGNNTGTIVDNPGDTDADTDTDTDTGTDTDAGTDTDGPTNNGGTTGADDDLGQVDEGELAFTGGDALSLAVIGSAAVGAGALLMAASRRKNEDD